MAETGLSKAEARLLAYQRLRAARAARFPFPIEGRIPNFQGAEAAAARLRQLPVYQKARTVKVNPDAPQWPVRAMALADGKRVIMPSPRLRGGFVVIEPAAVPKGEERRAASLSHCHLYGREVGPDELKEFLPVDLIIVGSVAVTRLGARAGKGEGYADMEYALLRELGQPEVPVVTTVHASQIVPEMLRDTYDLSLDYIVTPADVIVTNTPYPKPEGMDWSLLSDADLAAMPVLRRLREIHWERLTTPDVLAPGLRILFVGINPGRASAARGHNFAGPGNHFWRLLYDAGLTPRLLAPEEERELLRYGIGITNVVARPSRGEADLTWDELAAGGAALRERVAALRPRIVALLGKQVYRAYSGAGRHAPVAWGLQAAQTVPGVREFVAPNPSARSTVPYAERLALFNALRRLADSGHAAD